MENCASAPADFCVSFNDEVRGMVKMSSTWQRTKPLLFAAAGMVLVGPIGFAQAAATPVLTGAAVDAASAKLPEWDVVSVKPAQLPCSQGSLLKPTPDGIDILCLPVQALVRYAFGINEDSRILGAPSWLKEAFYSIEAKVSGEDAAAYAKLSKGQRNLMLQALLADRFNLKAHNETRDLPIYALVVAKGGSKLMQSHPDEAATAMMRMKGEGEIDATASSVESLPMFLTRELDRPVINKTGLTGKYDFTLKFTPGQSAGSDSEAASIFVAVQEQLGLKLEPTKAPLDVLVIDHVEKPTEN
jgi:uncharacterized protein (TIGR03435 family)